VVERKVEEVKQEPRVAPAQPATQRPKSEAEQLDSYAPTPTGIQDPQFGAVTIKNSPLADSSSRKGQQKFVEVSGTLLNRNSFAIKNVLIRCGDISYASGDVTAVVEKVVPARSELQVSRLHMGPIVPHLPPTTCRVAHFDRAD